MAVKDNLSIHRNLMQAPELQNSLDYALMEYQSRLSGDEIANFNIAAVNHIKMSGALEFIDILKHLAESNAPSRQAVDFNLNHDLK